MRLVRVHRLQHGCTDREFCGLAAVRYGRETPVISRTGSQPPAHWEPGRLPWGRRAPRHHSSSASSFTGKLLVAQFLPRLGRAGRGLPGQGAAVPDLGRHWAWRHGVAGYSARGCLGPAPCVPDPDGPIGTLPNYCENDLVSNCDPPRSSPPAGRSWGLDWENGTRLSYASITTNFPRCQGFAARRRSRCRTATTLPGAVAGDNDADVTPGQRCGRRIHDPASGAVGDGRGSSANRLAFVFLGDYNYAVATGEYAAAVWADSRAAAVCPAVNAYRQLLVDGSPNPAPAPDQDCPDVGGLFGNTDILGRSYLDPAHPDGRAVGGCLGGASPPSLRYVPIGTTVERNPQPRHRAQSRRDSGRAGPPPTLQTPGRANGTAVGLTNAERK